MMVEPAQEPVSWDFHARPGRIVETGLGETGIVFGTETPKACEIHAHSFDSLM
jgi:hypothetical protein